MSMFKEMQFPVSVRWRGGGLTYAEAHGERLEVATPPEFRSGLAGYWSPEDLLVVAVTSCFSLTLAAVADRRGASLVDSTITATGHMSHRDDGRFGFTVIEIDALLETVEGGEEAVRAAADAALKACIVTQALDVPVHLGVKVAVVAPHA